MGNQTEFRAHDFATWAKKGFLGPVRHTELGEEEEQGKERRDEGDDAAGESAAVEILIDLGVRVQRPQLIKHLVHSYSPPQHRPPTTLFLSAQQSI